jgi:RNA polymerase sigma-70 factor (ECF subfamily)
MSSEAVLQSPQALAEMGAATKVSSAIQQPIGATNPGSILSGLSDEELLGYVGECRTDALATLFHRHGRAVLNVAWRILRDEAEAADLRQEVFLYLFQRAHLYDAAKSSASSWIIQITYHRAIDRRRHLCSRQHYNVVELDEERTNALIQQPSTDELDGRAILDKLRDQLSPDQQQTLELHFFEGYSLREIAEKSGQSLGNVRHHYYRALERLRSNLFSKKQG